MGRKALVITFITFIIFISLSFPKPSYAACCNGCSCNPLYEYTCCANGYSYECDPLTKKWSSPYKCLCGACADSLSCLVPYCSSNCECGCSSIDCSGGVCKDKYCSSSCRCGCSSTSCTGGICAQCPCELNGGLCVKNTTCSELGLCNSSQYCGTGWQCCKTCPTSPPAPTNTPELFASPTPLPGLTQVPCGLYNNQCSGSCNIGAKCQPSGNTCVCGPSDCFGCGSQPTPNCLALGYPSGSYPICNFTTCSWGCTGGACCAVWSKKFPGRARFLQGNGLFIRQNGIGLKRSKCLCKDIETRWQTC